MAGTSADSDELHYACKCLNVRIRPATTQLVATESVEDPDFTQVFVGEEGISVGHTEVTARTRTRGTPIAGTSRCYRYTTITCLLCSLLVYRVYQTYPEDLEGKDGPLLPSEGWAERDIMQSQTGWIEVHKQCLSGNAVEQTMLSPNYSRTFALLIPHTTPLSKSPEPIFEGPLSRSSISPPPPPPRYFSNLRPVFLPPPFSPSHPVFTHLSTIALKESQAIRDAAEDYMTEHRKAKISEIEKADAELKRSVDSVWKKFQEGVSQIQHKQVQTNPRRTSSSRSRERSSSNGRDPSAHGAPISVRTFVPAVVSRTRSASPSAPRISALSASLATSSFHHPRAKLNRTSPPPSNRSPSVASNGSNNSSQSNSSTLIAPQLPDGSNVLKFRRNLQETIDTATSYRFFVNLEEDMARHQRGRHLETDRSQQDSHQTQQGGSSHANTGQPANGDKTSKKPPSESQSNAEKFDQPAERLEDDLSPTRGREKSKGKRKVTFDVQPAVVTIKRDVLADKEEQDELANQDQREMIFELEDIDEDGTQQSPNSSRPTLQLVEQPVAPVRARKPRPPTAAGLSASFSGLRPSSLPTPSHIRPPRSQHGSDLSSPSMVPPLPKPQARKEKEKEPSNSKAGPSATEVENPINIQDAEILKLVAADNPSHRGGWKPESKAWQTFVRRQPGNRTSGGNIPEEGEVDGGDTQNISITQSRSRRFPHQGDDEDEFNNQSLFVGSLPIPIKMMKQREQLSLASYQVKTIAAQIKARASVASQKQPSSTSIRKAAYAERDRSRSMDPGSLDFTTEDDDVEEEDKGEEDNIQSNQNGTDAGGRGRNHALRILQARSEVPEAGMWRSLAS